MSNPKFKMGDHVRVSASGKTGFIKSVFDAYAWGMWTGFEHEYTVEMDDGSGAPTLVEGDLETIDPELPRGISCVCGAAATRNPNCHARWCDLYED